ncbi:MAG: hypothetical protein OEN02_17260 [Gammaproteobacteria bacterium]|nr:hypothetical protein [Gammaproteobacteria bacterium]MDH3536423.1 hypothetical protein [Gammaproteobacteria bacterium]
MKYTGHKDAPGEKVFIDDPVYRPDFGEHVIKYRLDLGGFVMRPSTEFNAGNPWLESVRDMSLLSKNNFTVGGHGSDSPGEVNRKIAAIIARKPS